MTTDPDYSTYTLVELLEAQSSVDAERFPERVAEIERLIQVGGVAPPEPERPKTPHPLPPEFTKRGMGLMLAVIGGYSTIRLMDGTLSGSALLAYSLVAVLFGGLCCSGLLILFRFRQGLWLGLIVSLLHIPMFQVGTYAYSVSASPSLTLLLTPRTGFSFGTTPTIQFGWSGSAGPVLLGVNLIGVMMFAVLASHVLRTEKARRRLRQRRERPAAEDNIRRT